MNPRLESPTTNEIEVGSTTHAVSILFYGDDSFINEMDELDQQILGILKKDSRRSYVDIAEQVNLSEAAIRRRIQNLLSDGIIKRFTIDQVPTSLSSALLMIVVVTGMGSDAVSRKIKMVKSVRDVFEITGEYQIAVVLDSPTSEGIRSAIEEIRKLEGIEDIYTSIILRHLA